MVFVLVGISLLFVGIGYMVTENNAKYLLAGYNTMSKEQQTTIDIASYIRVFRRFHVFLGTSLGIIGLGCWLLFGEQLTTLFITVYPLAAYLYLWFKSAKIIR